MNELNAKVAGILGWTKSVRGIFWRSPGDVRRRANPQFDADPTLLPEMLAWLKQEMPEHCSLALTMSKQEWYAGVEEFADFSEGMDVVVSAVAPTICEAVARLVVAVAEEKP